MTDKENERKWHTDRHRWVSAFALFQKGLYHLFMLRSEPPADCFVEVLRKYQATYHLGAAQILLDPAEVIGPATVGSHLKKIAKQDPGPAIQHYKIKKWGGFAPGHPLHELSLRTQDLFERVHAVRDNVLYRPLFRPSGNTYHWEDCTVEDLFGELPNIEEIEALYQEFHKVIAESASTDLQAELQFSLEWPLTSPPITLLLNYGRLLDRAPYPNRERLRELREYRKRLLGIDPKEDDLDMVGDGGNL